MGHITISDKKNCCGCTACASKCPKHAITMREDDEGFLYPFVDERICIDCEICLNVCPIIGGNHHKETARFYAVKHLSEDVRKCSSSGGVFSAIAETFIAGGGVIYGAAYDEQFIVKHIRVDSMDWIRLRTAKYVQSDLRGVFNQIKDDLAAQREVLFTGTPCQVDGLKHFLSGSNTDKLVTIDLVCHAAPSPKVWRDYLSLVGGKMGSIKSVNFRNKENCGWHNSTVRIIGKNDEIMIDDTHSVGFYSQLFFSSLSIRPSCLSCQYANLKRCGDLTIGDYWGVEKYYPELDDDKGVSLVLVNSQKGISLMERGAEQCELVSIKQEEAMQPQLMQPLADSGNRTVFWSTYKRFGLMFAGKRIGLLNKSLKDRLYVFLVRLYDKLFK